MANNKSASEFLDIENCLAEAGLNKQVRETIFEALRHAEMESDDAQVFRNKIRWPLIFALLRDVKNHQITMENGLIFEVRPDSRIERSFLLSSNSHPDHVWEPQTTKLLVALGSDVSNVIVGGAYIGDHVLLIARAMLDKNNPGKVHAFEPDPTVFVRLQRHLVLNSLSNVISHQSGLWEKSAIPLHIEGDAALAITAPVEKDDVSDGETIRSVSIDDYVKSQQLSSVGLIMLDTEGAEEMGLLGAADLLSRSYPDAPNLVFEVHRNYVNWSNGLENTSIVKFVESRGYVVFAIRDFHDNYPMKDKSIEIIPVDSVYLEGPPHGFNLFATKDSNLVTRLGLRIVKDVSPKLLVDKDPAIHHPLGGL